MCLQKDTYKNVHNSFTLCGSKLQTTQMSKSKMGIYIFCVHTMEYYTAIKHELLLYIT